MSDNDVSSIFDNIIESIPYVKRNRLLSNYERYQISLPFYINDRIFDNGFMADSSEQALRDIFLKKVSSIIFDTNYVDYINTIGSGDISDCITKEIYYHLSPFSNMITNTGLSYKILTKIQSSVGYYQTTDFKADFYFFGNIFGKKCFVDPLMNYNDNRICLFNSLEIDIRNVKRIDKRFDNFSNTSRIEFDFYSRVSGQKVLYIINSEESDEYKMYKQSIRNEKINNLLK